MCKFYVYSSKYDAKEGFFNPGQVVPVCFSVAQDLCYTFCMHVHFCACETFFLNFHISRNAVKCPVERKILSSMQQDKLLLFVIVLLKI